MGWWKTRNDTAVVGDIPLDALGVAHARIIAQYKAAFGRRPTIAEWEELLTLTLGLSQDEYRSSDEGIPTQVHIETEKH